MDTYWSEFELISTKTIFKLCDMIPDEIEFYKKYFAINGCIINNPEKFFDIPDGGERSFNNKNISTDRIRIRRWVWTYNKIKHELIPYVS